MLSEEHRYQILKILDTDPDLSQRELALKLGFSIGKANYCIKALIEKGSVKVNNFKKSSKKTGYLYLLTPQGIEEKAFLTKKFLKSKIQEYEQLENEIEELREEVLRNTSEDKLA